jgi:butyryl-CoA dehydrogenase
MKRQNTNKGGIMDFRLSEQHEMLRTMIRDFASKEIAPIAADIDKSGEFPRDCIKKLAELGTFGLLVPPPFGGSGPDKLGFFIANEEIARASASISVSLIHSCLVSFFTLALGNDEQKKKYLSALAKGERLGAFCMAESGSAANWALTLQTTAQLSGDEYVINGAKSFISNGGEAEVYLVLARTDPAKGPMGISGLIVEKGTRGFSFGKREEKIGLRGDVTSELVFENCRVPKANMLSESIVMPMGGIMTTLALPSIGAAALGVASAALDAAVEYVRQRTVIPGQTLANFDGVQSTIAEMSSKVEASRLLVYQAGLVEGQPPDPIPGLLASTYPCKAAIEVTGDALQLIGAPVTPRTLQ